MLKVRVIPVLLHKNFGLVKGKNFVNGRRIGSAMQAIRLYNMRQVDEIILLDVAATPEGRGPDFDAIAEIAEECFTPLTVGGGVRTLEDIRRLLLAGADKVAIGAEAFRRPLFIREAAEKFGSQCIVITTEGPMEQAVRAEFHGAGEILLNSIGRDGWMCGYDLYWIGLVSKMVKIPVIACGGAGTYEHMAEALRAGAHAVAASAMFHFTEHTPQGARKYLSEQGFPMRPL
jgi:cyclase